MPLRSKQRTLILEKQRRENNYQPDVEFVNQSQDHRMNEWEHVECERQCAGASSHEQDNNYDACSAYSELFFYKDNRHDANSLQQQCAEHIAWSDESDNDGCGSDIAEVSNSSRSDTHQPSQATCTSTSARMSAYKTLPRFCTSYYCMLSAAHRDGTRKMTTPTAS